MTDSQPPALSRLYHALAAVDGESAMARAAVLSSREAAGRYPGSDGEKYAADAIQSMLEQEGLCALDELGAYQDPFAFRVCDFLRSPSLRVSAPAGPRELEHLRDYAVYVQGAAGAGHAEGQTIWLGGLDDLTGVDLRNKIGVVDGVMPGADVTVAYHAYLRHLRKARDLGLAALLRVHPPVNVRKVMIHDKEEPSLPSFAITSDVVMELFGTTTPALCATGHRVDVDSPLVYHEVASAGNVVASMGSGPVGLVLCAHYDHLGALPDGRYFPGASDNASGVAVVLGAASVLARTWESPPHRMVLLFTTGEEIGMAGARRFLERFSRALAPDVGVVCVDEVSGSSRIPLYLLRAPGWHEPLTAPGDESIVGIPVRPGRLRRDGYADDVAFLEHGIERVAALLSRDASAGITHTPSDTLEQLSAARLAAGIRALSLVAWRMAVRAPQGP